MASPCLYLDIDHNGISGSTWPNTGAAVNLRVEYEELPETEEKQSRFDAALKTLLENPSFSACSRAVVTIPSAWGWFRYTTLPFNDKKKLAQILPLELTPGYLDQDREILLDFKVTQPLADNENHSVFTGSLAESKVKEIFTPLSKMGLSPAVITPKSLAQAMTFSSNRPEFKNFLLVHITPTETALTLVKNNFPLMVRALTAAEPGHRTLAQEINTSLISAGLKTDLGIESLKETPIFISCSNRKEVGDSLSTALKKTWPEWNGTITTISPENIETQITPDRQPPYLLNFCVGPYKTDSFLSHYKGRMITTVMLLTVIFCLGVFDLHRKNSNLDAQISQVRNASLAVYKKTFPDSRATPVHAPLMLMESRVKQARQSRNGSGSLSQFPGKGPKVMELLHELSTRIPGTIDMEITRMSLNRDRLVITGLTANFNDVDRIKGLAQASPRFKNVSIQSAETDKTGKKVRFKFILEI